MRSNSTVGAVASVLVGLLIIATVGDWVTSKNGPAVVTGISNAVAKIIDVSLGKDTST
jgi:hypothetical protein